MLLVDDPLRAEYVVLVIAEPKQFLKNVAVVLTQAGRAAELVGPLAVDQPRDAERRGDPAVQTFNLSREPARHQMWVAQHLVRLDAHSRGDAVRLQTVGTLLCSPRGSPATNGRVDRVVVNTPSLRGAQP